MAVIAANDRIMVGHEGSVFIDGHLWHEYLTQLDLSYASTTQNVSTWRSGGRNKLVEVSQGTDLSMTGWVYDDNDALDAVRGEWRQKDVVHNVLWGQQGVDIGDEVELVQVIGKDLGRSQPLDGVRSMTLSGELAGIHEVFTLDAGTSDMDVGDWLWTGTNSHLTHIHHVTAEDEPVYGFSTTAVDADTKCVWLKYTVKPVSGFSDTFIDGDSFWRIVWTRATTEGQSTGQKQGITDWVPFAGATTHGQVVIDKPNNILNNKLALEFDLGPHQTGHSTYGIELYKQFTWHIFD